MKRIMVSIPAFMMVRLMFACAGPKRVADNHNTSVENDDENMTSSKSEIRVLAEWEPHAATWMQWPNRRESELRPAFADIIGIVQDYEPVHLLTSSQSERVEAKQFLAEKGVPDTNITWHIIQVDNAWMRDNGPVYVTDGTRTWIQNWKFDAWGGNFGRDVLFNNDDHVPDRVASYLGITSEDHQEYVLERGNLEFNGAGTLVLNWDCQDDRNPGLAQAEHETILKEAFDLTRIIWAYGHWQEDGTTGHIDGYARFIDRDTIAIADYGEYASETEKNLAKACEEAGLEVIWFSGDVNWLVGNGFVVAGATGDDAADAVAKSQLEFLFSDRDIYLIDVRTIRIAGGGIHCVTNDQPFIE
jgi:agmatine deiminase